MSCEIQAAIIGAIVGAIIGGIFGLAGYWFGHWLARNDAHKAAIEQLFADAAKEFRAVWWPVYIKAIEIKDTQDTKPIVFHEINNFFKKDSRFELSTKSFKRYILPEKRMKSFVNICDAFFGGNEHHCNYYDFAEKINEETPEGEVANRKRFLETVENLLKFTEE